MKKYLTIIKITWQRALMYRFSVYAYRVGEIVSVLALMLLWTAIYSKNEVIKGYTYNEMITYVLIGSLIDVIVRNWLYEVIADDIKSGLLSNFITKPVQYLNYIISREIGRISFAFIASVLTQSFIILIFYKKIVFNFDISVLAVIIPMIILAFIMELLLSFIIGLIAFWTTEIKGVHYTIYKAKDLISGGFFPLSLLPPIFVNLSLLFPFAYSFFVPTQLYLKKMDLSYGIKGIGIQIIWIILLYSIIKIVWKKGLRKYESVGI